MIYLNHVQIYEFARGKTLFDPHKDLEKTGLSPEQTHISQMVALLGDFPRSLLHKGRNVHLYFDENGEQTASTLALTSIKMLFSSQAASSEMREAKVRPWKASLQNQATMKEM